MLFHQLEFLFYFLPAALLLHRFALTDQKGLEYPNAARAVLLCSTFLFYGWKHPWWLAPFAFCVACDFLWATLLQRATSPSLRKLLLGASISQNLAVLSAFKYWNPAILFIVKRHPAVKNYLGTHGWEMPAGISFYTFESLSFVIDVYRRQVVVGRSPLDFFGFIAMFPRFIAGPIVRYRELAPQLHNYRGMNPQSGLCLFAYGLFLKLCFADSFAVFADFAFASGYCVNRTAAAIGLFSYSMQIYLDFAGYSWMALGLGRCFGFEFPENFRTPYLSSSVTEFWSRWHISLTRWLRDYVYIPLGGSRSGEWKQYRNIFITMMVSALWHGAGISFLFWGLWHGTIMCLERFLGWNKKSPSLVGCVRTVGLVVLGFAWFGATDLAQATRIFTMLIEGGTNRSVGFDFFYTRPLALFFSLVGVAHIFLIEKYLAPLNWGTEEPIPFWGQFATAVGVGLALVLGLSQTEIPFLYFKF